MLRLSGQSNVLILDLVWSDTWVLSRSGESRIGYVHPRNALGGEIGG